jgi:hypothetical protein
MDDTLDKDLSRLLGNRVCDHGRWQVVQFGIYV